MSTSSTTTTTTTKTKPVIGVDVDDVLTPLISHLLEFYNRKYDAQIRFEDFLSFRYHEVNIHTYMYIHVYIYIHISMLSIPVTIHLLGLG